MAASSPAVRAHLQAAAPPQPGPRQPPIGASSWRRVTAHHGLPTTGAARRLTTAPAAAAPAAPSLSPAPAALPFRVLDAVPWRASPHSGGGGGGAAPLASAHAPHAPAAAATAAPCAASPSGIATAAAAEPLLPAQQDERVRAAYDVPPDLAWADALQPHPVSPGSGSIEIITGPMFAGKSTALLERVMELSREGREVVVVKSQLDRRYAGHWVVTHDGRRCVRSFTAASLSEFKSQMGHHYTKFQVIAIDEAQFFPDLLDFAATAADQDGKQVVAAGLVSDFRRRPFGRLGDLLPLADRVTKLDAACYYCQRPASFSQRICGGGQQAVVGGSDKYRAVCRRCYVSRAEAAPASECGGHQG